MAVRPLRLFVRRQGLAAIKLMKMVHRLSHVVLVCTFASITLIGCSNRDDHKHPGLKTGKALFNHHCADCHGEDGTGKLADRTPANILTKKGHQGIVKYVTSNINPNRNMPVFSNMPYSEATKIASHLLSLRNTYNATPTSQKKLRALLIEP